MELRRRSIVAALICFALGACNGNTGATPSYLPAAAVPGTFAAYGNDAIDALLNAWFDRRGDDWLSCPERVCTSQPGDWGQDSLTTVIWERWSVTKDPSLAITLSGLATSLHAANIPAAQGRRRLPSGCTSGYSCDSGSDRYMWDAVAAMRVYSATNDSNTLKDAETYYRSVAKSSLFGAGKCPLIDYQLVNSTTYIPDGGGLKTLETDANRILAASLIYESDPKPEFLADAKLRYDAVRAAFLDPNVSLYTVYVLDDGHACKQIPQRFFASVNGVMIEAGVELNRITHDPRYLNDAQATAHAVRLLADARGVFTDLQAQNDIVEPLVVAMLKLVPSTPDAQTWLIQNAAAAVHARSSDALAFGRFFDGPAPAARTSMFEGNGALALMVAAASLAPSQVPEQSDPWPNAIVYNVEIQVDAQSVPFTFTGSGIALVGAIGEGCGPKGAFVSFPGGALCESGHVHLLIDGSPMTDQTGIWQRKDIFSSPLPNSVLFAWRWPTSGLHTLQFQPGESNPKEGLSFLHVQQELVIP